MPLETCDTVWKWSVLEWKVSAWACGSVSWEPQRGEGTSMRDQDLRSGSVRQDGRHQSVAWRGPFCGIWHLRMTDQPTGQLGMCPCSVLCSTALRGLPGLFSAPSQFPHLHLILVQYLLRPILAALRTSSGNALSRHGKLHVHLFTGTSPAWLIGTLRFTVINENKYHFKVLVYTHFLVALGRLRKMHFSECLM